MTDSDSRETFLFLDDEAAMRDLAGDYFEGESLQPQVVASYDDAVAALQEGRVSAVVTDLNLGGAKTGIDLCRKSATINPDLPVIVMTAFGDVDKAIDALRAGAYDFLRKPVDFDHLHNTLTRAMELFRLKGEVRRLRSLTPAERLEEPPGGMVGESPAMRDIYDLIARLGRTSVSVLIEAETGCGKELAARAVHQVSSRSDGPFVAVNVAAIPETLLESELFGHKRGAFTGAHSDHDGLFRRADGGTLFLDEIGEMPLAMQVKLLRALEEGRVRPVGGDREVAFDARVVAATNRDLLAEIEAGAFREDLYYRLNVVRLQLPPLRARGNDVLLLAQHFVEEFAKRYGVEVTGVHATAAAILLDYDWPGNVRELRNAMDRAVALAQGTLVVPEDLPPRVRGVAGAPRRRLNDAGDEVEMVPLEVVERRHIEAVVNAMDGNRTLAAEVLQIDRKTLYRKLKRYEEDADG